jgi:hypothetical protein
MYAAVVLVLAVYPVIVMVATVLLIVVKWLLVGRLTPGESVRSTVGVHSSILYVVPANACLLQLHHSRLQ